MRPGVAEGKILAEAKMLEALSAKAWVVFKNRRYFFKSSWHFCRKPHDFLHHIASSHFTLANEEFRADERPRIL